VVITDHVAKDGTPKIVEHCTLPLTGRKVVDRIITDRAVLDLTDHGLVLRQLAPGETVESLREITGAPFTEENPHA
jgi:3-oxoacid CoA-transferase subunit B